MYYLAEILPAVKKIRIPLTRDQLILLMLALNEILLGFETWSAHIISGTIVFGEWIPIITGPVCGVILLIAGLISLRSRKLASYLGLATLTVSLLVGLLGTFYHVSRAVLFTAPAGSQVTIPLIIWAPPIIAPLMFCLLSLLGIFAIFQETQIDSGKVRFGERTFQLAVSKSRAFFLTVGFAILATLISSVLDHARTDFSNVWLWIPTGVGVFACISALGLGLIGKPARGDLITFLAAMLLMMLTGLVGAWLHIRIDLTADGSFVMERFIRGAPPLAPLLFADMGAFGLIALLNQKEESKTEKEPFDVMKT